MFKYSIDNKKDIRTPDGDIIKDLTTAMFSRNADKVLDYEIYKMSEFCEMRPDKVAQIVFGNIDGAEFILKFAGIGNPFNLDKDDVLLIPNETQAIGMTAFEAAEDDEATNRAIEAQIRNYYKFTNQFYKPDSTSYDNLAKMDIPSGIINPNQATNYMVPYISEDGRTAVIIRNGRMYFGEDSGVPTALTAGTTSDGVINSVQDAINKSLTALSDSNCLYNGMSTTDFNRATMKNK